MESRAAILSSLFQAPYDEIKKVIKAASEDPVLGNYIGYTEDQVETHIHLIGYHGSTVAIGCV